MADKVPTPQENEPRIMKIQLKRNKYAPKTKDVEKEDRTDNWTIKTELTEEVGVINIQPIDNSETDTADEFSDDEDRLIVVDDEQVSEHTPTQVETTVPTPNNATTTTNSNTPNTETVPTRQEAIAASHRRVQNAGMFKLKNFVHRTHPYQQTRQATHTVPTQRYTRIAPQTTSNQNHTQSCLLYTSDAADD